jgi:hypothetical protein
MSKTSDALHQAVAILDHVAIAIGVYQEVRDKTADEDWDGFIDGPLGELLDALSDLE